MISLETEMQVRGLLEIGICDDQVESAEILRDLLSRYLEKRCLDARITMFQSAEKLMAGRFLEFQVIFLDIVMEEQDGIQTALQIRRKNPDVSLLLVSAYLDYATRGYQVKANAYLLKSQLMTTLDAAMDAVLLERRLNHGVIEIAVGGCVVPLPLRQIMYIESQGRTAIFNCEEEYSTYMRFSDIETALSGRGFLRVHRCYIVNMRHCVTIKNYQVILDNGKTLPCSRQEYRSLMQRLMRWKGTNQ